MNKRLILLSISLFAIASLFAGCGGSKAATTSSAPIPATTTQSVTPTTTAVPTTSSVAVTSTVPPTTSVAPTTSSAPPTTTPAQTTSAPPTSKAVYVIQAYTAGVYDMEAKVKVGTTVRWTPAGHEERTLISEIPGLFGGFLTSNPWVEYTFNEVGTFYYGFKEIPGYRASVTVTA